MTDLSAANTKLVQYLNEAFGLEKRLETALDAHIALTTDASYKKRLKLHLTETKHHARDVKKRVKQLGGSASTVDAPGPAPVVDAAQVVLSGVQKATALAQGPLHALRGTGDAEKQLKNAKTEYASEAEEIATYAAIETLAGILGDKETQLLARAIGREEERMKSFLEKEIVRQTKAMAKAEIPASERRGGRPTRSRSTARPKAKKASTATARPTQSGRSRG